MWISPFTALNHQLVCLYFRHVYAAQCHLSVRCTCYRERCLY